MIQAETTPRVTIDTMITKYVQLRDRKKEIETKHKEELKPFDDMMERLEGWMLEALNQSGLSSMKSPAGTAYKSVRTSTKVIDWPSTLAFIKEHQAWDLLEARVSKLVAAAIIEETKQPIPGVETQSEVVCNVRRAPASSASGK